MKLSKWVKDSPLKPGQIAKALEVSRITLWKYCAGKLVPGPEAMKRIIEATGGKVQPNDFFEAATPKRRRRAS